MSYNIELKHVDFIPKLLEGGILYVSRQFNVAAHLCPCGCGNKIITPLGQAEWSFKENKGKPSLNPSIGNWQIPCRSHYWIKNGQIVWSNKWTDKQIEEGRIKEQARRELFYNKKVSKSKAFWKKIKKWGSK